MAACLAPQLPFQMWLGLQLLKFFCLRMQQVTHLLNLRMPSQQKWQHQFQRNKHAACPVVCGFNFRAQCGNFLPQRGEFLIDFCHFFLLVIRRNLTPINNQS